MSHSYSIGKELRKTTLTSSVEVPGPGKYMPIIEASSQMHPQPKWSLHGTKNRDVPIINGIPGPGQYNPKLYTSNRGPIITGRLVTNDRENQQKPGPNAYNTDISQLLHIGAKFSKAKRDNDKNSKSPGPGEYNVDRRNSPPCVRIGTAIRGSKEQINPLGPGAYQIPTTLRTDVGFQIVPRRERTHSLMTPAPNAYSVKSKDRVVSYRIGTSKRQGMNKSGITPGPGVYYPKLADTTVSFSIGREKRGEQRTESMPGPGAYNSDKFRFAPKYTMMSRHDESTERVGPGPQAYNLQDFKKETKSIVFGHSKRDTQSRENFPGPGQYQQVNKLSNTAIIFGREKRNYLQSDKYQPGPGQYNIKSMFGDSSLSK